RDFSNIFSYDFDIIFTKRDREDNEPINTGLVFIKNSSETIKFFETLLKTVDSMLKNKSFHEKYREKYKGIMQAALGYMLEEKVYSENLIIKYVPCDYYNACDGEYDKICSATRMIHLKKGMRDVILREGNTIREKYNRVFRRWRKYAILAGVKEGKITDEHTDLFKIKNISKRSFEIRQGYYFKPSKIKEVDKKTMDILIKRYPKDFEIIKEK
ncbi:hypothetical protein GF396_04550, partial [Candidatus Pacearchaeota archaeon]|nr:hypothetical protein [Candidatus Pacearchaeota archaeon]